MRSSYVIAAIMTVVAVAWVGSGQVGGKETSPEAEIAIPSMAKETPKISVRVRMVEAQTVNRDLILLGRTEASRTVQIRAETAGRVEKAFVGLIGALTQRLDEVARP